MDWAVTAQELNRYLLLNSFPVGVKLVPRREELPAKTRTPRDLGVRLALCQLIALARRYGWTLAVGREEHNCPLGSIIMGFEPAVPFYLEGNVAEGTYVATREAGARSEAALRRLDHAPDRWVVVGPLDRITFDPDVVVIHGHPAQMMRLVQASLYREGGALTSSFLGRGACSEEIVAPLLSGRCQLAMPCTGERMFAQTQDHEMAFGIPAARVAEVLEGLAGTHRLGIRYPITSYLRYEAAFPEKYRRLAEELARG